MVKFVKYIGLVLIGIMIIALIFNYSSPMLKAKTSLRILGIDEINNAEFSQTCDLILNNKFERYDSLDLIDPIYKEYLRKYHLKNKTYRIDTLKPLELKDLYAVEGERWNSTDNLVFGGLPFMKFEYAYCSDKAFILCTEVGGLGTSFLIEVFAVQNDEIVLLNTINVQSSALFFAAFSLRFNENLSDYNSLMSDQDQLITPVEKME